MQFACAILSSVSCPTLQYFATLSYERHDLEKEKNLLFFFFLNREGKIRVLIFSTTLSETYLILRRTDRDMIKKYLVVFM